MTCVAKQRHTADRPARQRVAVEQRPDEAFVGGADDAADLRVPALECGKRALDSRAVRPVLAIPFIVLGPADKIKKPAARHEVMHEMTARPDPGLATELKLEIGEALDRN